MNRDKFITFKFDKEKCQKQESSKRSIEGLSTTFGNKDLDDDIIESFAWDEQLAEGGGTLVVKALWQHQSFSPIGLVDITKVDVGLFSVMNMTPDVQQANEGLASAKFGAIDAFSIGFRILEEHFDANRQANIITKARLREVSLVTFEANPLAKISDVKSVKDVAMLKRQLERCLRDVGNVSKSFAESIIANGFNGLGELVEHKDSKERKLLIKHLKNLEHT